VREPENGVWLGSLRIGYTYHRCRPWTQKESYGIWYHISDYCLGGIGGYWGIHHVDIAQWGHGRENGGPIEVEGTATFPENGLTDCAVSWNVRVKYADGVTMVYTDNKQNKQGVVFQGTEGWVYVRRGHIDAEPQSLLSTKIGPDEIHLIESPGHQRNFLDCIKTRKQTVADIDDAVRSQPHADPLHARTVAVGPLVARESTFRHRMTSHRWTLVVIRIATRRRPVNTRPRLGAVIIAQSALPRQAQPRGPLGAVIVAAAALHTTADSATDALGDVACAAAFNATITAVAQRVAKELNGKSRVARTHAQQHYFQIDKPFHDHGPPSAKRFRTGPFSASSAVTGL